MKWVTRRQIRVNRAATAWLVRRFIDPEATFLFVEPEAVAEVQRREGATGFDAPCACYPHEDERGAGAGGAGDSAGVAACGWPGRWAARERRSQCAR